MDADEVGRLWNENAESWTTLARAGYDVYRDEFNTPAFLRLLPEVAGLSGLDLGCGEGYNTRLIAALGARMTGVDIAARFVAAAAAEEDRAPRGIDFREGSGLDLPFADRTFDFVVATMSLMDMPETTRVLAEVWRVLRPGGFLQFSITHPCFDTPHRRLLRDASGRAYALEVGGYFRRLDGEISQWIFGATPPALKAQHRPFRVPRFTRTMAEWINLLIEAGFTIEKLAEPTADDATVARCPDLQDTQVVGYFLHVRVRKGHVA